MRILHKGKDGGPKSCVDGFWLIEIKGLFSVLLLRFNNGAREAFHTHAFNAYTWFLWGDLTEEFQDTAPRRYRRRLHPKFTPRDLLHRVRSRGTSWVFTVRGPWADTWREWSPATNRYTTLTNGRRVVAESNPR